MILTKSKIYEMRIINLDLLDKKFLDDYCRWDSMTTRNIQMNRMAYEGHIKFLHFFIRKGASDWNWAMAWAAEGDQGKMIDFFIFKGADNWNQGMAYAAYVGHEKIVNFFLSKGADNLSRGKAYTHRNNHRKLEKFFERLIKCKV